MKIIISPDSFKGSMTSEEASFAMAIGVRSVIPGAEIVSIPVADGGEGSMHALVSSTKGHLKNVKSVDPLGRFLIGQYGILGDDRTAVIEMANVSGLLKLKTEERNPLFTTTYGTGLLILDAIESGYRDLIIAIGGSSTNDCGTGMAQALGVKFFRKDRSEIIEKMCGHLLGDVAAVDIRGLHPAINLCNITVACDVKNPLLGNSGCTRVYSPQKGATPHIIEQLENNMKSFIDIAENILQQSVRDIEGAGAAGGLGAGLILFLKARLRKGIDIILDACNFTLLIRDADLILTGEGKIDNQTTSGKTIAGIALRAKPLNIPVIAFAGVIDNAEELYQYGVDSFFSICERPMSSEQSMADAKVLLQRVVERVMRVYVRR